MKEKPATDPRFDPRFQRGYSGPHPQVPSTPAAPSPLEQPPPSDRDDPVRQPAVEFSQAAAPMVSESGALPLDEVETASTPPRRNPFGLALLVGGAAMIAIGAWLLWTAATAPSNTSVYTVDQQALLLLQQQLAPALLICGTLGIVGWLVLGALVAAARKAR